MARSGCPADTPWAAEEEEVLCKEWLEWSKTSSGQARRGFKEHIQTVFPQRTFWAIKQKMSRLRGKGRVPSQHERAAYVSYPLSLVDAAWLAGIMDGEGSIRKVYTSNVKGLKNGWVIQVVPCYNTDLAIINKVASLVPHARLTWSVPKGTFKGHKLICKVCLSGYRPVYDYLNAILPFLVHTEKRKRAILMIGFLQDRLRERFKRAT